jgi:hypothetical protein
MDNTLPLSQPRHPLHGVTLEMIVTALAEHYGWPCRASFRKGKAVVGPVWRPATPIPDSTPHA